MTTTDKGLRPVTVVVAALLLLGGAGAVFATTIALGVPRASMEAKSVREGSPKTGHSRGGRVFFVGGGYRGGK